MAQIDVSLPMDKDLMDKFYDLCYDLGVNATTVISAFAESVVNKRSLPAELDVEPDPFYSPENIAELRRRAAILDAGGGTEHELIEVDDDEDMGKPEPLKHIKGFWSREIDKKNRLVYKIENGEVRISQCGTHYRDK